MGVKVKSDCEYCSGTGFKLVKIGEEVEKDLCHCVRIVPDGDLTLGPFNKDNNYKTVTLKEGRYE